MAERRRKKKVADVPRRAWWDVDPGVVYKPLGQVRIDPAFARPKLCVLCDSTGILRDERELPLACVCTPAGRMLANRGLSDSEVRARLEGHGDDDQEAEGARSGPR